MKTWLKILLFMIVLVPILWWNWTLYKKLERLEKHLTLYEETVKKIDSLEAEVETGKRLRQIDKRNYERIRENINSPVVYDDTRDKELLYLLDKFERLYVGEKEDVIHTPN